MIFCGGKHFVFYYVNLILYFVGIYLFAMGLMPLRAPKAHNPNLNNLPDEPILFSNNDSFLGNSQYKRTVFILIDALRADFILPQSWPSGISNSMFTHVNDMIKNEFAIAFTTKVFSPTVTLPRIKTLVSGSLPSFMDILLNFNAQRMAKDNLITQAHFAGRRLVFYGDNTWIDLFPEEFQRYEGTHSFYVSDYKEVDDNVTRHLDDEFSEKDWDILVLHYLGVDHIGHAYGPQSSLMSAKLKEMDYIIFSIFQSLQQTTNDSSDDLIVVCGDHGMTSGGSHGGNSLGELYTPLVFINKKFERLQKSLSNDISQVDVAVTLSILLGLPIPTDSMGVVIPEVLYASGMSSGQVLYALHNNLQQLHRLYQRELEEPKLFPIVQKILEKHTKWLKKHSDTEINYLVNIYLEGMKEIKHFLISNSSGYNDDYLLLGLLIIWLTTIFFIVKLTDYDLTLTSLYQDGILISILSFVMWMLLHHVIRSIFFSVIVLSSYRIIKGSMLFIPSDYLRKKIYIVLLPLPIIGLASSSYVEEEHQTWYFLLTTILLWLILLPLFIFVNCILTGAIGPDASSSKVWAKFCPTQTDMWNGLLLPCLLVIFRILRSWNQTGDKWAHLPDISDWLVEKSHSHVLYLLVTVSILVIAVFVFTQLKRNMCHITFYVVLSGMIWLYIYRYCSVVTKLIWIFIGFGSTSNIEPCFIYVHSLSIMCIAISNSFFGSKTQIPVVRLRYFLSCAIVSWILLIGTIMREHNVPLIAGTLLAECLLNRITWTQATDTFHNMTCYLFASMCSFFHVGNSNSISTIDVYTGYTGLTTYQPFLVGFLLVCNTYSLFILWLLLAFYRISCRYLVVDHTNENNVIKQNVLACSHYMFLYRILTLSICITLTYVQRYHLFILSVFVPKLFYEMCHTLIYIIVILIVYIIC